MQIVLKNISKVFIDEPGGKLKVLQDINLEIEKGEFFIFLGPSGSGKSTLLRIISGLEKPSTGSIVLGEGLSKNDFSFIFQQFALLPWLTVEENVEMGLFAKDIAQEKRKSIVAEQLKTLGLGGFVKSRPYELSGGMKQRVGIARALATDPKVIFMDEPFSELDSFTAKELRNLVLNLWQKEKPTIIMVTHNIEEAIELGDRIAVLTSRPGKIGKIFENKLPRPRQKRSPNFYHLEDEIYSVIRP